MPLPAQRLPREEPRPLDGEEHPAQPAGPHRLDIDALRQHRHLAAADQRDVARLVQHRLAHREQHDHDADADARSQAGGRASATFLTRRWRKASVPIIGHRPVLGHDPAVQHVDDAASLRGQALVVGHDEEGGAVAIEPAKEVEDLAAGGGVELTGRLVGEQDRRPVGQRAGDGHPLHLSTGELGGTVPRAVAEPDVLQQLPGTLPSPGRRHTGLGHRELDVLSSGEHRQQMEALEDEAEPSEIGDG